MPDKKEREYKVLLKSPDGKLTRTMLVVADSNTKAKRIAERNAEDVDEQFGNGLYEVESVEAS
jgi:hypothetical protein